MLFIGLTSASGAERRVALIIGNADYQHAPSLLNPINDAEDLAASLERVGFSVLLERNLSKRGMELAVARFVRLAQNADAALVFYAGHGMQYRGQNYLVPVDAKFDDEVTLAFELNRIDDLIFGLDGARGVKILILDACRNNPLAERLARLSRTRDLGLDRGLARIEGARAQGMIIAYSTQPNQVAIDGVGRNSPFATALMTEINEPGVEISALFRRVARAVNRDTDGKQLPELSISLLGDFYLNTRETDLQVWARVRTSNDPREIQAFIAAHSKSFLIPDARQRLEMLEQEERARFRQAERERAQRERERIARERTEHEESARAEHERERLAREQAAAERRRLTEEQAAREAAETEKARIQAALLSPPTSPMPSVNPVPDYGVLVREIKKELKRIGCYAGSIESLWTAPQVKASVRRFAKFARVPASDEPSADFLSILRRKTERVCPVECSSDAVLGANGTCIKKKSRETTSAPAKSTQACHPRAVCLERLGIPADCKTGVALELRVSDRHNLVINNCLDKQRDR